MNREPIRTTETYGKGSMKTGTLLMNGLILLFVFLAFLPGYAAAQKGDVVATVVLINGHVDFRENASANWKPAKKFEALYEGCQLRAETGNKAKIIYNATGASVLINENTQIEVHSQAGAKPKLSKDRTKLIMGEIYNRIKPGSKYEVETPSSVASVRGTVFDSQYDPESDEATFLVLESTVELMNQLGTVLLNQYQTSTVKTGSAPPDPTTLSSSDAKKKTAWKDGVEPRWRLNMVPEGGADHEVGAAFTIGLAVLNTGTLSLDNSASFALKSFAALGDAFEFSIDGGKTWTGEPRVTIVNGLASFQARAKAVGGTELTASVNDAEPATIALNGTKPKDRKSIDIQFTDPDGKTQKTLKLELEEK